MSEWFDGSLAETIDDSEYFESIIKEQGPGFGIISTPEGKTTTQILVSLTFSVSVNNNGLIQ